MRSPEFGDSGRRSVPKNKFSGEYQYQYLAPESFTVLTSERQLTGTSPPRAPEPYRLTPTTKRNKSQSFSILAEPTSTASSRSGSPTGRVSPFRGRGFNPVGSRHASPAPSPTPPFSPENHQSSKSRSHIPKPVRHGSSENISQHARPNAQTISQPSKHSRSMTNISSRHIAGKPPPSPRHGYKNSFVRLSPIAGSSPEGGSDQMSSPSKIPRSKSQPPSRLISPNVSKHPSRSVSRNPSRNPSRNTSREPSPTHLGSPSRGPSKSSYKNIPAKIDSFSRAQKPRVPHKPKLSVIQASVDRGRPPIARKNSKVKNDSREDSEDNDKENVQNSMRNTYNIAKIQSRYKFNVNNRKKEDGEKTASGKLQNKTGKNVTDKKSLSRTNSVKNGLNKNVNGDNPKKSSSKGAKENLDEILVDSTDTDQEKEDDILSVTIEHMLGPTTAEIVSSTTAAITQPLKVEAKLSKPAEHTENSAETKQKEDTKEKPEQSKTEATVKDSSNYNNKPNSNSTATSGSESKPNVAVPSKVVETKLNESKKEAELPMSHNAPPSDPVKPENASMHQEPLEKPTITMNNSMKSATLSADKPVMDGEMKSNNLNGTTPDHEKLSKPYMTTNVHSNSANERMKQARTVVVDEIKPIKIMVREKSTDMEVQSGNMPLPRSATNGIMERPMVPPANQQQNPNEELSTEPKKQNVCSRFFSGCGDKMRSTCTSKNKSTEQLHADEGNQEGGDHEEEEEMEKKSGCFNCRKQKKTESTKSLQNVRVEFEDEEPKKCWDKLNCCKCSRNKVHDQESTSCFPKMRKDNNKLDENWADRRDSILSDAPKAKGRCASLKNILCCVPWCSKCKRKPQDKPMDDPLGRTSMASKKKSLTSTMQQPPPEDTKSKLDNNLIEHTSHMRGAIPVLPISMAWMCAIFNVFMPGIGTILSGMICLCIGRPRFSAKDGIKPRIGAFFIDIIVGISQLFTVLFCLVGWGWSIWWGVIMIKVARKYKKIKRAEKLQEEEDNAPAASLSQKDVEKGHK